MAVGRGIYKYITTEHVLMMFVFAWSPIIPTQTQYIERRIRDQMGIPVYEISACIMNKSSTEYKLSQKVQKESGIWSLYLTGIMALNVLYSANILGALSDKYGRHVALILPCIGILVNSVINIFVIHYRLPLYVLIFGSLVQGVCGDIVTFIVGCAGYTADVTAPDSRDRTVHFVMIDTIYSFSIAICQFALGTIINHYGFIAPFFGNIGFMAVTALLIIFFVPNRKHQSSEPSLSVSINSAHNETHSNPLNILKNIFRLFAKNKRRGFLLAGYNFIIFEVVLFGVALLAISVLYTTGEPFCLNPFQEGVYQGTMAAVSVVGTLFGGTVLTKFMSKFWMMHMIVLAIGAYFVITALAQTVWMLYVGLAMGLFIFLILPLSRNSLANLVGPHEQGVVFAFSGCLMSLAGLLSPLIFNAIYSSTLQMMPGFVYLTMALLLSLGWIVVILLHIFEPRQTRYVSINQDETSDTSDTCDKVE